jgi:nucleoid-associated protein YgaU
MGFFDFIRETGARLFGDDDEPEAPTEEVDEAAVAEQKAQTIRDLLNSELGESAAGLEAAYAAGDVTLSGECETIAVKEKAILLAGNVLGVARVNDDNVTVTAPEPEDETEFYVIQAGDSLSKIAKQYYDDAQKYTLIFEANREVIGEPDLIYPGQTIRIPKLEA